MAQSRASLSFLPPDRGARLLARAGLAVGLVLLAGCASTGSPAGISAPSPVGPGATAPPPASTLTSAAPTPTAQSSASAPASQSAAAAEACAAFAAHTFIYVRGVTTSPDGSLTLSANPASVVCGGPDDLHYDVSTTTVTCYLAPAAAISVFDLFAMSSKHIAVRQFAAYLATDTGTRIFLVTGTLTAIDSLVEQYHP
jgi:hypothetical protein